MSDAMRSTFSYDPDTGNLTWIVGDRRGKIAGCINTCGYRVIWYDGRLRLAHRLVWAYHFNEMPSDEIDHINGDRADNRIANLRIATHAQNLANQRTRKKRRFKGVCFHLRSQKWMASCGEKYLGLFETPELAAAAYDSAAIEMFGAFARLNKMGDELRGLMPT